MSIEIRKWCPNCSQLFSLKSLSPKQNSNNLPIHLKCGHSMCENCITNLVKFGEPIECKICHKDMKIPSSDVKLLVTNKLKLRELFPVNIYLLGELSLEVLHQTNNEGKNIDDDCFLDLEAIIQASETCQGQCLECTNPTTQKCIQCDIVLCEVCFNKSHKNFVIFRNHVHQNIELKLSQNKCKMHTDKTLVYYCKDCSKGICTDCMLMGDEKSCKNHNLISTQEFNEKLLENLAAMYPKVDGTYRRLTKTAVDIGHLLHHIKNDNESSQLYQIEKDIEQSFSKLSYNIQMLKYKTFNKIMKMKSAKKESLENAKGLVAEYIKNANTVLKAMKNSVSVEKIKQANMALLLKDAEKVANSPWYLNQINPEIKVVVNEEVCDLLSNFIHLEGETDGIYKLLTTEEIDANVEIPPPPPAPVFPPEIPKDVRLKKIQKKPEDQAINTKPQAFYTKAPTYHSKSASVSSLNSINSDSSYKSSSTNKDYALYKPVHQVPPYQENEQPKPLCAGGQELVYISHIVTPHHFFVQRVFDMPMVEELVKEFRNAISLPKPSVNSIAEGNLYLVFNKTDNLWQRCRVNNIDRKDSNKHLYHVFCIDFGSMEVVTIDKLRLLQPARAQSPPPFAVNCSLANCEPLAGSWSSDDALLMQNIINNKQAVLHIQRVVSGAGGARVHCDLNTYDWGVSLAHALVFQGRARLCNDKLPYPKNINAGNKPKLFINNNDYKIKTMEDVYITSIVSPDHFFVRKLHLQSVYEKLCEELDHNYNLNLKTDSIYLPEKDMVCVVNLEKYNVVAAHTSAVRATWARCVVRELPGRGRVRLALPDCGATLVAHWTALRRVHPNFLTLKALSTECHLHGVTPPNQQWSPSSVALLQTYRGRALQLHVDDTRGRALAVTLYDTADPEHVVCVNTEMVKYKQAVTTGTFMFNKENVLQDRVITNKLPAERDQWPRTSKKKTNIVKVLKKTEELPKYTVKNEHLEAKDKGPLRLEAQVLYYQSPSLIYLSLVHQQKTFNTLLENMQKHYSKKSESKSTWAVGDKCCALCQQSQTWRRAAVLELQGDDAKLFYSDFAYVETVPVTTLRELTQEFASIGYAAVKCHLSGVVSADGEEWPSLTKEYLSELLNAYKRVFITKRGNFKDMSMPIEIWVYHTIQGGALEPNTSEWRCLNKKIIEQGLAIPDKSQQVETPNDKADNSDNILSFFNLKGSVEEWLQLEPMPTKPLCIDQADSDRSNSSSPECEINFSNDKAKKANTVFISNWMPAEPPPNKEFVGVPTYIDNDGIIYIHEVSQQDTLEMIQKALDVRFNKPDPKAKYASWSVGEPCIALYYLDDKFYRGRILEVNKEASTCLVHYIDYGNDETCNFSNLRKSIALYQLPTQAMKCLLTGIEPVDKFWDRQTLDYIHKSVVEKKCFIKITGDSFDGIYPIELTFNKLKINDHLVEFEMAKYSDGSKAVIRRYAPADKQRELDNSATIESDSAPDYIVEEEDIESANDSYCMDSLQGLDWNLIIQKDEEKQIHLGSFVSFKNNEIDNFICNITVINDIEYFELFVLHDEAIVTEYEKMFQKLQEVASDLPPLNGIYENKACLAIFNEDGQWYRATILQYSNDTNQIKVKYADYGNIELVDLADVREINEKLVNLPPMTVTATLHDVRVNPAIETSVIAEEYKKTFLDKGPFHVTVINNENDLPSVELRNEESELVYQDLYENKIFLHSSNEAEPPTLDLHID